MKKIKVAQVITRLDWGGAPDIYRILSAGLDPDVFDVTLVTGPTAHVTKKTSEFLAAFHHKVKIIPLLKREIDLPADLTAFFSLWNLFKRERFDIVNTHTAKAGALGRLAARLAGVKAVVHTPHGHNLYGYFGDKLTNTIRIAESCLSGFTDKIIALTELEKSDYIKFNIARADKIEVIYQGLELSKYACDRKSGAARKKAFNISDDESVVGMISRLETVKGPEYFIEMAVEVIKKFPKTKFIVAGEGSLREMLMNKARNLGVAGDIRFAGWLEDVPEVLSMLDVLVAPSLNEAVGISLIEAQAAGIGVVATRVGGIPEVVKDRVTGLLVAPANVAELSKAVTELISSREMRDRMGREGKVWVSDKFAAEKMIHRFSDLYMELLDKRNR